MKRRYALATLGAALSGGCLRTLQTGGDSAGTETSERGAPTSGPGTTTERPTRTTETRTPAPDAVPTGMTERWEFNGVSEHAKLRDGQLYAAGFGSAYGLDLDGTVVWEYQTAGNPYYGVAVDGDHVYTGTKRGFVHAIDRETGEEAWRHRLAEEASARSAPLVAGDTVILNTRDPHGYVGLATDTGEQRWRVEGGLITGQGPTVPGTVAGAPPRVYLRKEDSVHRMVPETGEVEWTSDECQTEAPPTVVGDTVYVAGLHEKVAALDRETGGTEWTAETFGRTKTKPAVAGGRVFFGSQDNSVYAFRAGDGAQLWRYQTDGAVDGSPVVHRGTVYVSCDDVLYALDPENGDVLLETETKSGQFTRPVVTDDALYRVAGADLLAYGLELEVQS